MKTMGSKEINTKEITSNINDSFAFGLIKIELVECSPVHSIVKVDLRPELLNFQNITHGGVIFTLADTAAGSIMTCSGKPCVTLNSSISFLATSKTGTIYAEATVVSSTYKIGVYDIKVRHEDGTLLATATYTMYLKKVQNND